MNTTMRGSRSNYLLFAAAGWMIVGHPAAAQQISTAPDVIGEITVVAPHEVDRKVVGRTSSGIPIEEISLTRHVSYADLDLTKHPDVVELQTRVSNTAKDACKQLNILYPLDRNQSAAKDRECIRRAIGGATPQVDKIIAVANS